MTDTAAADLRILARTPVTVRLLTAEDLDFAAALHAAALPHGFFGRLGIGFLRAYYASFAASPHAAAFVALVGGARAGVLVGTVANGAHYAWVLRRYGVRLAVRGALALAVRPRELAFFLRTRVGRYLRGFERLRKTHAQAQCPDAPRKVAVLTHVAVDPRARGAGVGGVLVETFVGVAGAAGADEACLVTLAGPDGAADFYRRLGWTYNGDRPDIDGRPISVFKRRL